MNTRQTDLPCGCKTPLATSIGHCGYCGGTIRSTEPAKWVPLANPVDVAAGETVGIQVPKWAEGDEIHVTAYRSDSGEVVEPTHDPTKTPGVEQLPAMMTSMTPVDFQNWIEMPGTMFIVYLPERKSFVIKVPDEHHTFFVDILKQLRLALGPEVQAQSATPLTPAPQGEERQPAERWHDLGERADDPADPGDWPPADFDGCNECGSV